jgi:hypothetical protein
MLNKVLKELVDSIYGTEKARKRYEQLNPEERVIVADAAKGIITDQNENVSRGANWAVSQRAVLLLTQHKLICGKWTIPIAQIASCQLLKVKSILSEGAILKISTIDGINYQFGMQLNPEWAAQQVIPLSFEEAKIKHSAFSISIRVLLFGYLVYWAYTLFIDK